MKVPMPLGTAIFAFSLMGVLFSAAFLAIAGIGLSLAGSRFSEAAFVGMMIALVVSSVLGIALRIKKRGEISQ